MRINTRSLKLNDLAFARFCVWGNLMLIFFKLWKMETLESDSDELSCVGIVLK